MGPTSSAPTTGIRISRAPGSPASQSSFHDVEEEAVAELHEHRGADGGQSGAQPHDCSEHHRPATRRALDLPRQKLAELPRGSVRLGRDTQHGLDGGAGVQ